jgi:hypothetical protein
MNIMHVNWIDRSQKTLEQIKQLRAKNDQDRLDIIRNIRFALGALGQSVAGWMQWVNSPEIMATFSKVELQEMGETVMDLIEKFIEFDIEITDEGMQKGIAKRRDEQEGSRFVI